MSQVRWVWSLHSEPLHHEGSWLRWQYHLTLYTISRLSENFHNMVLFLSWWQTVVKWGKRQNYQCTYEGIKMAVADKEWHGALKIPGLLWRKHRACGAMRECHVKEFSGKVKYRSIRGRKEKIRNVLEVDGVFNNYSIEFCLDLKKRENKNLLNASACC